MASEIEHILQLDLFCKCGKCEEAVQDILRMERMMCQGAKAELTRRRKRIQKLLRRPYHQERWRQKAANRS